MVPRGVDIFGRPKFWGLEPLIFYEEGWAQKVFVTLHWGEGFWKSTPCINTSSCSEDWAKKEGMEVGKVRFRVTKTSRMSKLLFQFSEHHVRLSGASTVRPYLIKKLVSPAGLDLFTCNSRRCVWHCSRLPQWWGSANLEEKCCIATISEPAVFISKRRLASGHCCVRIGKMSRWGWLGAQLTSPCHVLI